MEIERKKRAANEELEETPLKAARCADQVLEFAMPEPIEDKAAAVDREFTRLTAELTTKIENRANDKCYEIMAQLTPFTEYMKEIGMNTFRNQPRLKQRLDVGHKFITTTKEDRSERMGEFQLYILRVCELLILSCMKPQIERTCVAGPLETALETNERKFLFWERKECRGLLSYLLATSKPNIEGHDDVQALRDIVNVRSTVTLSADIVLQAISVAEERVRTLLSQRQTELQRMIGAATGQTTGPTVEQALSAMSSQQSEEQNPGIGEGSSDGLALVQQIMQIFSSGAVN
eukprot:TRINITY_DN6242_c0_g1_i1.p1 TRINITY_DN6242_c0_g1~~TRINITY_DN6242_c0_g1_i1.p1  ORF type:complete len:291 (+),score=22.49 TRINITY_DN6242_c0_g1_i1:115-987(+)